MTPQEANERQKPGPKPTYGERKPLLTRVDPELAAEFEGYCAAAKGGPISVTEGLQRLIEEFCKKKREALQGKKPERPESAGPAPKSVTITALLSQSDPSEEPNGGQEVKPLTKPPPNKASPWGELSRRIKEWCANSDAWDVWLSSLEFGSLEHCKLSLMVPNSYFLGEVSERFGEDIELIASELCGEAITLALSVNPRAEAEQRQEEERQERERQAAEKEAKEKPLRVEKLKQLYLKKDARSAKEAEELLFVDGGLLDLLNSFQRKQIEQWLTAVSAGASYQTGKESEYKGPRGRR